MVSLFPHIKVKGAHIVPTNYDVHALHHDSSQGVVPTVEYLRLKFS